ncbi:MULTISPECIES: hypothetical protein [Rhodonellum]|nr:MULTISPECIES: hypothetical protein [Rhodonellum]MDO9554864.1 hypothetical protein [Rhodonellum sp.]SDY86180.1 hypothetical protein SAMN05444412_103180 [Rhodonellum ikkaensis]
MKKTYLILFSLMVLGIGNVFGQRPQSQYDKEKLESARVAFITNRLDLKPEQAEKFWPEFNKFSEEKNNLMDQLSQLNRASDGTISEGEASKMLDQKFALQQKILDREKAFMGEITKIIRPTQAIKLSSVNREFTRHVYRMNQKRNKD